jgi:hypothetical protein
LVDFFSWELRGRGQAYRKPMSRRRPASRPQRKRAEAGGPIKVAKETIVAIAKALEKAGVAFIAEDGGKNIG